MGLTDAVRQMAAGVFLERPGRGKSLDQWSAALEKNGAAIGQRAGNGTNEVRASKVLRHICGIERWGQSRLRVFLGAPFARDEYDGFQPGTDLTLDEQRALWCTTRAETIALVHDLARGNVPADATVVHNDFGPLTARGWLRYMDIHATLESKKIR